jgi:3',5'-cyclic-nucleotide phosphodiesterase
MKGFFALCLFISVQCFSQPAFRVVPLGVLGGLDENNLSSYMLAPYGTNQYVCLDAGTIKTGIDKAVALKTFRTSSSNVLRQYIKAYCISHAHLDHVAGMVINAPADSNKTIYGLNSCIQNLEDSYFNGEAWANFGDEGDPPLLKKYHFQRLAPSEPVNIATTGMKLTAFSLSHINPYESTAFLLQSDSNYVLYFGDTGPDELEHSDKLNTIWQRIAPLIISKKLKAIFIEVSFPDKQPDHLLFGHLTANWLMQEMEKLSGYTGKQALKNFKLVITHMKPPADNFPIIKRELQKQNKLGFQFIFPVQGIAFTL